MKLDGLKFVSFCSWEYNPAALFETGEGVPVALALLEPGGDWKVVDGWDVWRNAALVASGEELKSSFSRSFGNFELPNVDMALSLKSSALAVA